MFVLYHVQQDKVNWTIYSFMKRDIGPWSFKGAISINHVLYWTFVGIHGEPCFVFLRNQYLYNPWTRFQAPL